MPDISLLAGLGGAGLLLALAAALPRLLSRHGRLVAAEAKLAALSQMAAARDRSLGLLAQDLQAVGLALLGQTGGAGAGAAPAQARRLLHLSDQLSELLAAEARPRGLQPETVPLLPLLEEAVAATAAMLVPGAREWRLASPEFARLALRADPRALRGAVLPVLARAARMTREGDWIGLRPVLTADALAIVVEDEGAGLAAADLAAPAAAMPPDMPAAEGEAAPVPPQTRGLDFGLAAARALLEAHGGGLRMESLTGIGARAWLTLPRFCVLEPGEWAAAVTGTAGRGSAASSARFAPLPAASPTPAR
jgi:signal transduction histidine kinase